MVELLENDLFPQGHYPNIFTTQGIEVIGNFNENRFFVNISGFPYPIYQLKLTLSEDFREIRKELGKKYQKAIVSIFQCGINCEPSDEWIPIKPHISEFYLSLKGVEPILQKKFLYIPLRIDTESFNFNKIKKLLKKFVFPITIYLLKYDFLEKLYTVSNRYKRLAQIIELEKITFRSFWNYLIKIPVLTFQLIRLKKNPVDTLLKTIDMIAYYSPTSIIDREVPMYLPQEIGRKLSNLFHVENMRQEVKKIVSNSTVYFLSITAAEISFFGLMITIIIWLTQFLFWK